MECPRCKSKEIKIIAKATVDDAWEVYSCGKCCYSWRSTEQIQIHEKFLLDDEKIKAMQVIPPIPLLKGVV